MKTRNNDIFIIINNSYTFFQCFLHKGKSFVSYW